MCVIGQRPTAVVIDDEGDRHDNGYLAMSFAFFRTMAITHRAGPRCVASIHLRIARGAAT